MAAVAGSHRGVVKIAGGGGWWRSRWAVDGAIAVVVGVVSAADAWWSPPGTRPADGLTYLLLAASVGALLARRRWPVPVAVACGAGLTGWYLLGHRGELLQLAPMVALYTVAVRGDRRRSVVVGAVAVVWSGSLGWLAAEPPSAPMTEMLWPVAALLLGEVVRARRELDVAYAQREARGAAEREQEARRRVQRERLRIAREFHDVVAHTMAAVSVPMGVAVAAFDRRPRVGAGGAAAGAGLQPRRARGAAGSGEAAAGGLADVAVAAFAGTRPARLMDVRMPGLDGLAATGRIVADPHLEWVRVLMLTTFEIDEYVFEAMRLGASAFLLKDVDFDDLCAAIRVVAQGQGPLAPAVTRRVIDEFCRLRSRLVGVERLDVLTDREREVVALVAAGLSNGEIGVELAMSPLTAKTHVSRAMTKLEVRDRAQLVVLAFETGLARVGGGAT